MEEAMNTQTTQHSSDPQILLHHGSPSSLFSFWPCLSVCYSLLGILSSSWSVALDPFDPFNASIRRGYSDELAKYASRASILGARCVCTASVLRSASQRFAKRGYIFRLACVVQPINV
jgi:hypothetical protein